MTTNHEFVTIALEAGNFESLPTKKHLKRKTFEKASPGVIKAQIPGTVDQIFVTAGQRVAKGDTLMILEAMKMLNRIKAPIDGTIAELPVATGEKVAKNQLLLDLKPF